MRVVAVALAAVIVGFSAEAHAAYGDVMPPPNKAPRIPVESQQLKDAKEFEGQGVAVDGERININGREIRLFGIVTPNLSSNYGPKARQQLDRMLQGSVLCKVTDKDREGRPVAFCGTVDVPDVSYEMLRQGWAMADRKALKGSSVADIYSKVEQEAQSANRGIFAPTPLTTVVPLSNPNNSVTIATPAPDAKQAELAQTVSDVAAAIAPVASSVQPPAAVTTVPADQTATGSIAATQPGFIERFQIILGALILLAAASVYSSASVLVEGMRERQRRRVCAAALSGELMAARHICRSKARSLANYKLKEGETLRQAQMWPRIRTAVYAANVSSIGLLGSELARRVASIYGQSAEYAAYFQQPNMPRVPSPKSVADALNLLADHMDVVLEGLSQVETTGLSYMVDAADYAEAQQAAADAQIEDKAEETEQQGGLKKIARSVGGAFAKKPAKRKEAESLDADEDESEEGETNTQAAA